MQQTRYDPIYIYVRMCCTFSSFLGWREIPQLVRLLIIGSFLSPSPPPSFSLPLSLCCLNFRGWPILASVPLCIIATHSRANLAQRDLETLLSPRVRSLDLYVVSRGLSAASVCTRPRRVASALRHFSRVLVLVWQASSPLPF